MEHDPIRSRRHKKETAAMLIRLKGLIISFMSDHKLWNVIFLYEGNNMMKKIAKDLKLLALKEEVDDETTLKVDKQIRSVWRDTSNDGNLEISSPNKNS